MKTLFLFEHVPEGDIFFFEKEGDYSHLKEVYINGVNEKPEYEKLCDELNEIVYSEHGVLNTKGEVFLEPTKDWDIFVKCGFCG